MTRMPDSPLLIAAVVPAAGGSGRMGAAKQLLDVNGRPMLLGVVDALLGGEVTQVTVVVNAEVDARLSDGLPDRVRVVRNDNRASTMIDSVRIGLAMSQRDNPRPIAYLVCPCDAAGITAADVGRCVGAFIEAPHRIVVATYAGRRGHPMIFPASLADAVQSPECDAGLNHLARNRPELVREVACESPGTVANVNTPADYERIRRRD
jgi:molybdenum cofactor cytidylyltransferase